MCTWPFECNIRTDRCPSLIENRLAFVGPCTPDGSARARLLAAQRRDLGAWLDAPQMLALGLRLDDGVLRVYYYVYRPV